METLWATITQGQKTNNLMEFLWTIRTTWNLVMGLLAKRNDRKMLLDFQKLQTSLNEEKIKSIAQESLAENDDIAAIESYFIEFCRKNIGRFYYWLLQQAVEHEIAFYIYPLFVQSWKWNIDEVVSLFERSTDTLNILWRNTSQNQWQIFDIDGFDNPLFIIGDRICATEEFKKTVVWKLKWCPLMKIKSGVSWNLMTDFIISCIKFLAYRKSFASQI